MIDHGIAVKSIVGFLAFVAIVTLLLYATRQMRRSKLRRFRDRKSLDDHQLMQLFVPRRLSYQQFTRFLVVVERASEIPRGLMRPTDRFDTELAPVQGWEFDDGLIFLPKVLSRQYGGRLEDYDITAHPTARDLMIAVERQLAALEFKDNQSAMSIQTEPEANADQLEP